MYILLPERACARHHARRGVVVLRTVGSFSRVACDPSGNPRCAEGRSPLGPVLGPPVEEVLRLLRMATGAGEKIREGLRGGDQADVVAEEGALEDRSRSGSGDEDVGALIDGA